MARYINLFEQSIRPMMEADEDPPDVDSPTADMSSDAGGDTSADDESSPPDIGDLDSGNMDDGESMDSGGYDDSSGDGSEGGETEEDPNNLPLDEKGEIFAKVELLGQYQYLYKRIDDTLATMDKIDLVQMGNSINSDDISELRQKFSNLMEDVYVTIVYEFKQQYSNLKIKLVEYSSKYVLLVNNLVRMIKKDQKV